MDIGERIQFVRRFRGMSQVELAEKVGLGANENGRTRISQYENGKRIPKDDILKKISEALNVHSYYLSTAEHTDALEFVFSLFELDNVCSIKFKKDEQGLWMDLNHPMFEEFLEDWINKKAELSKGKISKEEYIEWKINYTGWKK